MLCIDCWVCLDDRILVVLILGHNLCCALIAGFVLDDRILTVLILGHNLWFLFWYWLGLFIKYVYIYIGFEAPFSRHVNCDLDLKKRCLEISMQLHFCVWLTVYANIFWEILRFLWRQVHWMKGLSHLTSKGYWNVVWMLWFSFYLYVYLVGCF